MIDLTPATPQRGMACVAARAEAEAQQDVTLGPRYAASSASVRRSLTSTATSSVATL